MDETRSLKDFVTEHYSQNQAYDFEDKTDLTDIKTQRQNTKVCLKNLPRPLKEVGLKKMCERYGEVKHVVFWKDRNYAFVIFSSLSQAENAIRKINDCQSLGIKADFAHETKSRNRNQPFEDVIRMQQRPVYETEIIWEGRRLRGPFSQPQCVPDALIKMKDCATKEDYELSDLSKADPLKEFIYQYRNSTSVEFVELKRRIVNGRSVHIKNDELWQKIESKSKSSSGCYDISKASFSFRNSRLPDPLVLASPCSKCNEPSNQYCRVCDVPFCSIRCEQNDNIHNETCVNGKMFEINDFDEMNQTRDDEDVVNVPTKWIRKSNTRVLLTSFVDFKTVYVRPSNPHDDMEFIKLMNDVGKAVKTSAQLSAPECGSLVLAPFEMVYHRALILKLLDQNVAIVAFIDFGNVDTVRIAEMKVMAADLKKRPRMVTRFTLKNVPDAMCNEDALDILFQLLNKSAEVTVRFDEPYVPGDTECELATAAFDSVNRVITNANVSNARIEMHSWHEHPLNTVKITGQNIPVLILDNSSLLCGQLSVIKTTDIDLFQRNHELVQTIAKHLDREGDHITPGNMEYCLAKCSDNKWYRVQAVEIKYDGHITALFVDHGNVDILKINCFRIMPLVLMFPCITATVTCFDTADDITPAVVTKRKELLPNMSEVEFLELVYNENADDCIGTLPASIYEQLDEGSTQLKE